MMKMEGPGEETILLRCDAMRNPPLELPNGAK